MIDPRSRRVYAYRPGGDIQSLDEDDTLDVSDVVAGWSVLVGEIFG
jgi:hypothetical protein